jgi:outer membrane protein assembly factor BamB
MIQPHAIGNDELLTAWGDGLARVEVHREGDQWTTETRWTTKQLKPGFNDVVVESGSVYGLDDGILCCVDLATGQRRWKRGRYGHGQLLLLASPPRLLVMAETGDIVLVRATSERHEELGRVPALSDKTWNHPILAQGCLLVRNGAEMACFRGASRASEADKQPSERDRRDAYPTN